jgi:hypothetical protein
MSSWRVGSSLFGPLVPAALRTDVPQNRSFVASPSGEGEALHLLDGSLKPFRR